MVYTGSARAVERLADSDIGEHSKVCGLRVSIIIIIISTTTIVVVVTVMTLPVQTLAAVCRNADGLTQHLNSL